MWWLERRVALPLSRAVAAAPLVPFVIACGAAVTPATDESTSTGATATTTSTTDVETTADPATSTISATTADTTSTTTDDPTSADSGVIFDVAGVDDLPASDDTTTGGPPVDCDNIPQGPLPYTIKANIQATEDLAFDDQGNLIGSSGGSLFRTPYDAAPALWVPNAGVSAGLRATSEGMIVFAGGDNLSRINDVDAPEVILGGLSYPNGMDVDLDGHVYVAEQSGSRVRRIH